MLIWRRSLWLTQLVFAVVAFTPIRGLAQPSDTTRISTEPLFTSRDAWIFSAFAVGTVAMFGADRHFASVLQNPYRQESRFLHHQATNFRLVASPGTEIIGASLYGLGRITGNKRMADLGLHGTEAVLVGLGTVTIIKIAAGRQRPYVDVTTPHKFELGKGLRYEQNRSFPSGHTVMAFSAAAAVTTETSRWWPGSRGYVSTLMYGGASLVGLSRMYNNYHWASDVLAGAAIGTFAGRKVVAYHHSHPSNRIDKWFLGASLVNTGSGHSLHVSLMPGFGRRGQP